MSDFNAKLMNRAEVGALTLMGSISFLITKLIEDNKELFLRLNKNINPEKFEEYLNTFRNSSTLEDFLVNLEIQIVYMSDFLCDVMDGDLLTTLLKDIGTLNLFIDMEGIPEVAMTKPDAICNYLRIINNIKK